MNREFMLVTIGFLLLLSVPMVVIGLDIKSNHGDIVYLPIGMIIIGGICVLPIFLGKEQLDEVVQ